MPPVFDNVGRVARQLAAYGTAEVAVLAVNFLLLPVYTRVLTTREYGAFALLLVCEAFFKPLFRWGLDTAFLRFHYECRTDDDRRLLGGTIATFLLVVNGGLLALLLAIGPLLNSWLLGTRDFLSAYQLLALNLFLGTFLFLPLGRLRIQERSAEYATLTFVRSFGTVLARLALVVGFRLGVLGLMLADLVVTVLLGLALVGTFRRIVGRRVSARLLRTLLRFGLPQVPHGLLSQTMAMADRFVLGLYLPLRDVGIYLIGASIAAVLKLFPVAFEAAWMPFAFDSMRRADAPRLFARLATYAFGVLVALTLGMALLADEVVRLMVPAAFRPAAAVVPLLAVGIAIQSLAWFLATSLHIAKRADVYPVVTLIGAAVSVASSFVLIPPLGLWGAALATVAGQTATTAATAWFAQRAYRIPYETGRLAQLALLAVAIYATRDLVSTGGGWATVGVRVLWLLLFPAGLLALRFFRPEERHQIEEAVRALTYGRRQPAAVPGEAMPGDDRPTFSARER